MASARAAGVAIGIDRIRCDGHGVCAELLPERIRLDDWGYPIIDPAPLGPGLLSHGRRAVRSCPVLALRLEAPAAGQAAEGPSGRRQTNGRRADTGGVQV